MSGKKILTPERATEIKARTMILSDSLEPTDADTLMDVEDMDWYKELKAEETPGKNLRFYRKLHGLTQARLAKSWEWPNSLKGEGVT